MCVCVCVCMYVYICVCVCVFESRIFSLVDRSLISLVYLSLGYKVVQATPFSFRRFYLYNEIFDLLRCLLLLHRIFFLDPRSGINLEVLSLLSPVYDS